MPALNTEIDWPAVRVLALTVGVREAARRLGISEEATMKRCQREGWLASPEARQAAANSVALRAPSALSAAVRTPAQVMQDELSDLNGKSRLSVARGLRKASSHIEQMDGQEIVADASNVKQTVQSLALVHGWAANQTITKVAINLTGVAGDLSAPPATIEAEWEDSPNPEQSVGL